MNAAALTAVIGALCFFAAGQGGGAIMVVIGIIFFCIAALLAVAPPIHELDSAQRRDEMERLRLQEGEKPPGNGRRHE